MIRIETTGRSFCGWIESEVVLHTHVRLTALVVLLAAAVPASAGIIATESFEDYALGTPLGGADGGTGWTSAWTASRPYVTAQAMAMGPATYGSAGAQAARIQTTVNESEQSELFHRSFPAQSGTLYLGMRLQLESFETDDFLQFSLSNGSPLTGNASLSFGVRNAAGSPFFARVGNHSNTTNSTLTSANQTDYMLVVKISRDGASTYNRTDLWVNPSPLAEPATATATHVGPATGLGQVSILNVRIWSFEADDAVYFDDIRLGTSYAAVVPEPAGLSLLLLGLPALLRRRRG